ncbi:unnamed protein product [Caenorhabditis brenneri]
MDLYALAVVILLITVLIKFSEIIERLEHIPTVGLPITSFHSKRRRNRQKYEDVSDGSDEECTASLKEKVDKLREQSIDELGEQ